MAPETHNQHLSGSSLVGLSPSLVASVPTPVSVRIESSHRTPSWCHREVLYGWETHIWCQKCRECGEEGETHVFFPMQFPTRPPGKGHASCVDKYRKPPHSARGCPVWPGNLLFAALGASPAATFRCTSEGSWGGHLSGQLSWGGGTCKPNPCLVGHPTPLSRHLLNGAPGGA